MTMRRQQIVAALMLVGSSVLAGCASSASTVPGYMTPPAYRLFDVDRSMSCDAIAAAFQDAAVHAARLEIWLAIGQLGDYRLDRLQADGPSRLEDERGRLDALVDLQRYKGCRVLDPVATVAAERRGLEGDVAHWRLPRSSIPGRQGD